MSNDDLADLISLLAEFAGDGHWPEFQAKVKEMGFDFTEAQLEEATEILADRRFQVRVKE